MSNSHQNTTDFWISPETKLVGERISLLPMEYEHLELIADLGRDPRIWESFPADRSDPSVHFRHLTNGFVAMKRGEQQAFCIQIKNTGQIAGVTRLFHLDPKNRQLEIGSWLHPDFWRSGINTEAKFLLLQFCFENLETVRVQFRTDANNQRSRVALDKIGATFEGIFRNERIREDGSTRDAAFYSILDREWFGGVRESFLEKMAKFSWRSKFISTTT